MVTVAQGESTSTTDSITSSSSRSRSSIIIIIIITPANTTSLSRPLADRWIRRRYRYLGSALCVREARVPVLRWPPPATPCSPTVLLPVSGTGRPSSPPDSRISAIVSARPLQQPFSSLPSVWLLQCQQRATSPAALPGALIGAACRPGPAPSQRVLSARSRAALPKGPGAGPAVLQQKLTPKLKTHDQGGGLFVSRPLPFHHHPPPSSPLPPLAVPPAS
ncbi:hypothetical protein VTN02DRAFT_2667 [Thermoascus thermophilus]